MGIAAPADGAENAEDRCERLRVALGERSYDILVGADIVARAGVLMLEVLRRPQVVIVSDENVAALHLDRLCRSLDEAGIRHDSIVLPAGEATKSFSQLAALIDRLFAIGIERATTLVAFGGGVVGDLTGFAAAAALRGIDFIQIPTTLLAQVDSSVGGKTGINVEAGKNLVGAFHQPRLVLADTGVLDSLPRRELLAGYAEVVKYGAIDDRPFFEWLETNGPAVVTGDGAARRAAVLRSCAAKARIVAEDERESGCRALLNLGHTFGHALESAVGYGDRLLHGEAVAIGMVLAFDLSRRLGLAPGQDVERFQAHLAAVGLKTRLSDVPGMDWNTDDLIVRMASDKKVADGRLTFILARGIGEAFITRDVPRDMLAATLDAAIAGSAAP